TQISQTTSAGLSTVGLWSILYSKEAGGKKQQPVTMGLLTASDGASNTILLAHKGVDPTLQNIQPILCCGGGSAFLPSNNDGYFTDNYYLNMFRGSNGLEAYVFYSDSPRKAVLTNYEKTFTTPHTNVMPCVFGDGSVRSVK